MADALGWDIVPLARGHDRTGFGCGVPDLDAFLQRFARRSQDRDLSRTFVAALPGEIRVLGYFSLAAGSVAIRDLPEREQRRLPRYPVPVVHLERLAVDRSAAGRGLGERLLVEALRTALRASDAAGAYAVEVVAKDDRARGFYERYGFASLVDDRRHMYLPMATVRKALGG